MKHEVLKAEIKADRLGFLFECNYFDKTGDINSTKKFSTLISDVQITQEVSSLLNSIDQT
jgi:hypothetical protein